MKTCATLPCSEVSRCSIAGGCLRKKGRKQAPLEAPPLVAYNPMMGSRLDLGVYEEQPGVAEKRWRKKRVAYLEALLAGDLSTEAAAGYARELARLTSD